MKRNNTLLEETMMNDDVWALVWELRFISIELYQKRLMVTRFINQIFAFIFQTHPLYLPKRPSFLQIFSVFSYFLYSLFIKKIYIYIYIYILFFAFNSYFCLSWKNIYFLVFSWLIFMSLLKKIVNGTRFFWDQFFFLKKQTS